MHTSSKGLGQHLVWLAVAVLGAFALGTVALARGETINALWVVIAAVCVYLIAYRYYSRLDVYKRQADACRCTDPVRPPAAAADGGYGWRRCCGRRDSPGPPCRPRCPR